MGKSKKAEKDDSIDAGMRERAAKVMSLTKGDGHTNLEIYNLMYGNRSIDDTPKENKVCALRRGEVTLNDLVKIAKYTNVSLDWLVFGKERTTQAQENFPDKVTTTDFLNSVVALSRAPTVRDISIDVKHPSAMNDFRPSFTLSVDFYKSNLHQTDCLLFYTAEEILHGLDNLKGALALPPSTIKEKAIDNAKASFTDIPLLSRESGMRFRDEDFLPVPEEDYFDKY